MPTDDTVLSVSRLYIGGKIAKHHSDVVSALAHHPLSIWIDSREYAGLLYRAPIGTHRVLLGDERWVEVHIDQFHTIKLLK